MEEVRSALGEMDGVVASLASVESEKVLNADDEDGTLGDRAEQIQDLMFGVQTKMQKTGRYPAARARPPFRSRL